MTNGKLLLPILAIALLGISSLAAQPRRRTDPKKAAEPCTVPWTYTKVIEGVDGVGHLWKEDEIVQAVSRCKVDFPVTDGVKDDLRKHGASDKLIDAILHAAPPAPPEVKPKKVPKADLSIHCAPFECDISLNGQSAGVTQQGELNLPDLPIGQAVIDFTRKGYLSDQKTVEITAGSPNSISVTLAPDNSTKAEFGRRALQSMLAALGLDKDRKQLWELSTTGSATSWDSEGNSSEWEMNSAFLAPNMLRIDVRTAGAPPGALMLACRGERCEPKKRSGVFSGKHPPPPAESLTTNLVQFARCHFAVMLAQLTNPSAKISAPSFDESGQQDQHFTVETTDVSFNVTIGPQLRLASIVSNPKSGLGAGLTITFGKYLKFADFQYPGHTDIKLPGEVKRGIQVRVDSILPQSNLREKDFPQ